MAFVHLHNHSHYSLLDGLPKIKPMVKHAKGLGFAALALTDHGVMYGAIEFFNACKDNGLKPIIGQEAYIAPNQLTQKRPKLDEKYNHLILLAKNLEGYKNLLKLTTIAHKEGFYYKPRMDMDVLAAHAKGLMCSSGCLKGAVAQAILADKEDKAREVIERHLQMFGEGNYFLEVQHHPKLEKQMQVNETIYRLSKELGVPVIATCDCHYLHTHDSEAQDLLLCIGTGKVVTDTNRLDMRGVDLSMKTEAEMLVNFAGHEEAVLYTAEVAKMIDLEIPIGKLFFPKYDIPKGFDANSYLHERAYQGLASRFACAVDQLPSAACERLEYELDIIKQKGYAEYFLIVSDYVAWSKKQGIITTTRGSAAGSLVSYAVEIIEINPLDYNLPFERFLNPLRPSAPDIDFDIQDDRRHEVLEYVIGKYGTDRVAQIVTFGTMAARGAVRDVGRSLGMPYSEVDRISKMVPMGAQGFPMTIARAIKENPELGAIYKIEPGTKRLLDLAQKVEGCARHSSIHAAGVVISPEPLTEYTAVQLDEDSGTNVTQYEMKSVELAGLVKMDFLGIRNLSILGRSVELIKKLRGIEIDILTIPLDDKKTYEMLTRGETFGCFQLGGRGMTRYLMELKPTSIHDIMAMVALFRPGPMECIPEYIIRKQDPSRIVYPDPRLATILEKSYGLLVYQDDVLMTAITISGYDWLEADKLRKAMGKKIPEEMEAQKEKFITGAQKHGGLGKKQAEDLFKLIEPFAAYGFNKAHAASYGLVAYQTAYMKANYTVEYMASVMTAEHFDLDKIAEAIKECRHLGIQVLPPDVNESLANFTVVSDQVIRFGFLGVKNVGEAAIEAIIAERKARGPYASVSDLVRRLEDKYVNKKVVESLAKAGALDSLAERNQVLMNMEMILSFAKLQHQLAVSGQSSLFGGAQQRPTDLTLANVAAASDQDKMNWEKELLGVYLSSHPFEKTAAMLGDLVSKINHLGECPDGKDICVAGMITNSKTITTKKGDLMCFCQLEDDAGACELVVFPRVFASGPHLWTVDTMLLVKAKVQTGDGQAKLIAEKVWPINDQTLGDIKKVLKDGKLPAVSVHMEGPLKDPAGVYLHVPQPPDPFRTEQLKGLFALYQGPVPVYLKIGSSQYRTIKTRFRITVNQESKYQIEKITGPNSMVVVN
ncbi:MAG: DNA polymerase III subunit alpha [Parcubacteria group bacterium]|nr:DNA polymerase III subunit alpha [Parcubacteria group bacterium]